MYVEAHFGADAKRRMLELVQNLLASFDTSIDGLEWMSAATRAEAKKKLSKISVKIGYPDKWRDYSALAVAAATCWATCCARAEFEHQRYIARTGGPVDKGEWLMTPQTVNAYYNPTTNEIRFPAAILQPPFFDMNADDAVNYGAHRRGDRPRDQPRLRRPGRQFDGDGNLRDWWTAEDGAKFKQRAGDAGRSSSTAYTRARQPAPQRRAHAGREHRRPVAAWRSRSRPTGFRWTASRPR